MAEINNTNTLCVVRTNVMKSQFVTFFISKLYIIAFYKRKRILQYFVNILF